MNRYGTVGVLRFYPLLTCSEHPGRGLVVEVGVLSENARQELEEWEAGRRGAMLSSHSPTPDEFQAWLVLGEELSRSSH